MNLKQYHVLAMRTAKQMNNKLDQLVHGALGCASEPGELAESALAYCEGQPLNLNNIQEELGDGMWFAAYCCDTIGLTLPELEPLTYAPTTTRGVIVPMLALAMYTLRYNALGAAIATQIKGHAFYGKSLDKGLLEVTLKAYVEAIVCIGATVGFELTTILDANIAKLTLRYPTKYSDEAAIARADKPEESALAAVFLGDALTADYGELPRVVAFDPNFTDTLPPAAPDNGIVDYN